MSAELLKALLPFAGGAIGAVTGAYFKSWFDSRQQRRRLREEQEQTRWRPLHEAAGLFRKRLQDLAGIHRRTRSDLPFSPDTVSTDFCELYILRRVKVDLNDSDGNEPRRDARLAQTVRTRMAHHLNYAASSLYFAAAYLGHAEGAARALRQRSQVLPESAGIEIDDLLARVRAALQGNGAGIPWEEQESIAEMMWAPGGVLISYPEFRKRLLEVPGWEQFIGLFRFFVEFEPKIDYEVAASVRALGELENGLSRLLALGSGRVAAAPPQAN